jgi:hypothetical protein
MRTATKWCRTAVLSVVLGFVGGQGAAASNSKADLVGAVRGADERPIANATVTIRRTFAPFPRRQIVIAWSGDVSKTARTDSAGKFRIFGLDTNAMFQVLFAADSFRPIFHYRVKAWEPQEVTLRPAPQGADPESRARGRVTDEAGNPVTGAMVQVVGAHRKEGWQSSSWPDIESIVFTDENGAFVIRAEAPFIDVDLRVEVPGFAATSRLDAVKTGEAFREVRLKRGGSVRGVGMTAINDGSIDGVFEIMTDGEGQFHFRNLPPGRDYHLFGIMESLEERGSVPIQRVHVDESAETDIADLELRPGFVLSGNVRFNDGTPAPPNSMVTLSRTVVEAGREEYLDGWVVFLNKGKEGYFEFTGVPAEPVSLFIKGLPSTIYQHETRTSIQAGIGFWEV